ncbi:cupin domain-containing protein, partial [Rhizobium ruizarguesonis]
TGKVPLVHEGEEGGIVLSGRLEVTVDDERRILGAGDVSQICRGARHRAAHEYAARRRAQKRG